MAIKEDIWYLLSVVVMSVVVSNFALRQVSNVNADLLDIILGSSKLERFAEAAGYYNASAVADTTTVNQGAAPFIYDVLDNDTFSAYEPDTAFIPPVGLFLIDNTYISNIAGDTGASVTVVNTGVGTTNSNGYITDGEVQVDTTDTFVGTLTFDYTVCDRVTGVGPGDCSTATAEVIVQGPNTPPVAGNFSRNLTALSNDVYTTITNTSNGFASVYSDGDGDPIQAIRIDSLPVNGGTLEDGNGNPLSIGSIVDLNTSLFDGVNYIRNPIFAGPTDSFTYSVYDGMDFSPSFGTLTINLAYPTLPVATPDSVNVNQGDGQFFIDVLDNDYDLDHYTSTTTSYSTTTTTYYYGELYIENNAQITNITGDTGAVITVDPSFTSTNSSAPSQSGFDTFGRVSVTPSANFSGTLTFDYEVCDGSVVDAGPFSCSTGTVTVEVAGAANQAPTLTGVSVSLNEGDSYTFSTNDFDLHFNDPDGDTLTEVQILNPMPQNGTLTLNSNPVSVNDVILRADIPNLVYTPTSTIFSGLDSFGWNGNDGTEYAVQAQSVGISIAAVDNVPVAQDFAITTPYETNANFSSGGGSSDLFSDNFDTDPDATTQANGEFWNLESITVTDLPDNGTLYYNPGSGEIPLPQDQAIGGLEISSLYYSPDGGYSGQDTFQWIGFEAEGGGGGGLRPFEVSLPATVTITIQDQPNLAPSVSDIAVTATEDILYQFEESDFTTGFSDPNNGDVLSMVMIESLPNNGTLLLNGIPAVIGDEVAHDMINPAAGDGLQYEPNPEYCGNDSFSWKGQDDDANSPLYSVDAANVNITINCVNDLPTVVDIQKTTNEDTDLPFALADFTAAFQDLDTDSLTRILATSDPSSGILLLNGTTPVNSGDEVSVADISNLIYRPNPGYQGSDSFGWNGNDGTEYAATPAIVNITVVPQNDAPSVTDFNFTTPYETTFAFGGGTTLFESSFTDEDFVSQGTGELWEMDFVRILSLPTKGQLVLNQNGIDTPIQVNSDISTGSLQFLEYRPNQGEEGSDVFSWQGSDDIGNAVAPLDFAEPIGSLEFSNAANANITIQNNGDTAPLTEDFDRTTDFNQPYQFTLQDFVDNFNDIDGDTLESVTITTNPASGILTLNGLPYTNTPLTPADIPLLRYLPNNGYVGSDDFEYSIVTNNAVSNTSTITVTIEDYIALAIQLTKDTPDDEVVIDRQVCVDANVTNPNPYALENVVVRLVSDESKAPFVLGSYTIPETIVANNINDTTDEFSVVIERIEANDSFVIQNCALPKTQDLSFIDGTTFLDGSDKVSTDNVELDPPGSETVMDLIRTGSPQKNLGFTLFLQAVVLSLVFVWQKIKKGFRG